MPKTKNHRTNEAKAQEVLDELWIEKLIPFALKVGEITKDADEYTLHFHDARLRTAFVLMLEGEAFRDAVRSSVLKRVAKISGPLKGWHN